MLHLQGRINLVAVIMNTVPQMTRARIARGMLDAYGLPEVPVGVGSVAMNKMQQCDDTNLIPYYTEDADDRIFEGDELMGLILKLSPDQSLHLIGNGPLSDYESWLTNFAINFERSVIEVVLMGGVEDGLSTEGYIVPNGTANDEALGAMNNVFNRASARFVYKALQDLRIKTKIVTKVTAYAVMMKHDICKEMGWIGESLEARVKLNTQRFWEDCCAVRITPDRDRAWFVKFILGGIDPPISDGAPIEPYVSNNWPLYDMITVMVASGMGLDYLNPEVVNVNGVDHQIIGRSPANNGLADKEKFVSLMETILKLGNK